eukprot:TRINITY_DN15338_c0_g1_i2.p1 TRINITY_DN15338_c0_g1~~TRINITY_DN15338_c0_g1_i2.p1  ORF type:complete len:434 (-),score=100.78 TRINITY_DN15338_c0_g1_i2:172-1473(-)
MGACLASREEDDEVASVEKAAFENIHYSPSWRREMSGSRPRMVMPRSLLLCAVQRHPDVLDSFNLCFPAGQLKVNREDFEVFISSMNQKIRRTPPKKPRKKAPMRSSIPKTWLVELAESLEELEKEQIMIEAEEVCSPKEAVGDSHKQKPNEKRWGGAQELVQIASRKELQMLQTLTAQLKREYKGPHFRGDQLNSFTLLWFLRGTKCNVQEAYVLYTSCCKWQQQSGFFGICDWVCPYAQAALKCYPMVFHKTDIHGNPVIIEQAGQSDFAQILNNVGTEAQLRFYTQQLEATCKFRFPACSEVQQRTVHQTTNILDLKGIPVGTLFDSKARKFLQSIIQVCDMNYPEQMCRLFIVNAPTLFSAAWRVIRNFLDPVTRTKIQILGSDFLKEVTKLVPLESLPAMYGGSCDCPGGCMIRNPCLLYTSPSPRDS